MTRTNRPCDVRVCVRDGGRVVPGENEKRQQQQRGATRSQKCGLQSVAERRGRARSERNGRKRRRSRSGLIAPQILTWLILPPPPPVYLSKVTSYTNEGFKTSPRRLANSSRRPLKISSPMMLFARRKEGKICLIADGALSLPCNRNWTSFWISVFRIDCGF